MIFFPVFAAIQPRRPLNFSRSPIPIPFTLSLDGSFEGRPPSQSHFGTHPSFISEEFPSLFSKTYGNPFCNPLSFQIHAGMGGIPPSSSFSRSELQTLPISINPLDATLTRRLVSVHSKELTGKLSPLDATLTKNRGVTSFKQKNPSLSTSLSSPFVFIRLQIANFTTPFF